MNVLRTRGFINFCNDLNLLTRDRSFPSLPVSVTHIDADQCADLSIRECIGAAGRFVDGCIASEPLITEFTQTVRITKETRVGSDALSPEPIPVVDPPARFEGTKLAACTGMARYLARVAGEGDREEATRTMTAMGRLGCSD